MKRRGKMKGRRCSKSGSLPAGIIRYGFSSPIWGIPWWAIKIWSQDGGRFPGDWAVCCKNRLLSPKNRKRDGIPDFSERGNLSGILQEHASIEENVRSDTSNKNGR